MLSTYLIATLSSPTSFSPALEETQRYDNNIASYVINPRRMREGYGSRFVCVCVCVCVCLSVCYRTSCYIPRLYVQIEASYSSL